jgi:hypothetical protein
MSDSNLSLPTESEREARRRMAVRRIRKSAQLGGQCPDGAENALRNAFGISDAFLNNLAGTPRGVL